MKGWYEEFFRNYGHQYEKENFVHGTSGECDFIESEIGYDRHILILDIGCGTGRHSVELAKRGYDVTGIDLSESMLDIAREKARELNVSVNFLRHDARELPFLGKFGLVIMICEGAFPLMETDEMNYQILEGASKALNENGKLIFTTLNGLFPLFHSVKEFLASASKDGNAVYDKNSFDLMTFREHNLTRFTDDSGVEHVLECNERYYVPSEITWLLKSLNFTSIEIFGARLGAFSRHNELTTEDYEMLVIAQK